MYSCFICSNSFMNIATYLGHLKLYHKLTSTSHFLCNFENCYSNFQSIYSFKRHIQAHTKSIPSNNHIKPNICPRDKTSDNTCIDNIVSLDDNKSAVNSQTSRPPDLKSEIENFALKLYGNLNLSRKQAHLIILETKQLLETFVKTIEHDICNSDKTSENLKNIELFSNYQAFFKNVSTEYLLQKFLISTGDFKQPEEFLIEESALIDDLPIRKGVILPLRLHLKQYLERPNVLQGFIKKKNYC